MNIKHDTRACSDLQAEKPASNALNIATVLNLKFLKLFPGPVSGGLASNASLVDWLSTIIELLPIELFFAFHIQIPFRGKSGLGGIGEGCFEIHDFKNAKKRATI